MNSGLRYPAFAALLLWSLCAQAAVSAQLDRDQIEPGESVQLTLEREGSGSADPDLSPLKNDFDVLSRNSGSSLQIINGSISRHKSVRLTLSPKRSGTLTVPSLSWGGEQTAPLQLTVAAGGGSPAQAGSTNSPHVFFTRSLDESHPYVQSALLLTVRLHTDLPLQQASLDFSGNSDVLVQQIGQDQQSRELRDGHTFNVVTRQYLLQPQRSGTLTLDGPTLSAEVADNSGGPFGNDPFFSGMLGNTKPIRLHGKPIELAVRARPAAATGSDWLPARSLTLEHSLSPDSTALHAGDPLTLHLHLRAAGLSGTQLPDLASKLRLPDGIKAYPDQAKLDSSVDAGGIVGTRDQDIALIASQAGRYQVPELRVPWWDSKAGVQREIVLPAMRLDVAAASGGATTTITPSPHAAASAPAAAAPATKIPSTALHIDTRRARFWPWLSLALAMLWLATLCAWWQHARALRKSAPAASPSAPQRKAVKGRDARKAFVDACRQNDPLSAQRELLHWARQTDPAHPPAGLSAIAQRVQQPQITALLLELDRACFAGGDWNGEALAKTLTSLGGREKTRTQKTSELDPLYPS